MSMGIQQIVSGHNPPAPEQWPVEYEDFCRLFWKYKGLLKEQERNSAFWNATNENLQNAYRRLDEQEQELERAYGLNREYLDNIQEGLLLIDRDHRILDQHSVYLARLFHTDSIAGRPLADLVFPDPERYSVEREELSRFLSLLFNSTTASEGMLEELNPLADVTLQIPDGSGEQHQVRVATQFTRIVEGQEVSHVIFIFEDRTEIDRVQRELEDERDRRSSEIETISAILNAGPDTFVDFVEESASVLDEVESTLDALQDERVLEAALRKLHSLKGSAKYLELDRLSDLAHRMEEDLVRVKEGGAAPSSERRQELNEALARIRAQLDDTRQVAAKLREFSRMSEERINRDTDSLQGFLTSVARMADRIAGELGKKVHVATRCEAPDVSIARALRTSLIHVVRNALDHGIEPELERVAAGKPGTGRILIRAAREGTDCLLEVSDDGQGIDFEGVERRARELGLIPSGEMAGAAGERRLLNLLFSASFSSRDVATDISGRGFGLDVVRDTVAGLGGRITVSTERGKGTRFRLRVPLGEEE